MALSVLILLLNIGSTVGIVFANKYVFVVFPFPMALTFVHSVTQGLFVLAQTRACRPKKPLPFLIDVWIAVLTIGCIYLTNVSLRINSVDMYQIFKLLNIPTMCLLQYALQGKKHSLPVYLSLVVLTIGVGASTVAEFNLGLTQLGLAAGMAGVLVTVVDQIEIGRLKGKHEVDAVAFLHSNMYHRMAFGASVVCTTEFDAIETAPNMPLAAFIGLVVSCFLAVAINLTQIFIIGKFGPLTMNVVGHVKTMTIMAIGIAWTGPEFDTLLARKICGVIVAMAGAIKYGQLTSMPDVSLLDACLNILPCTRSDASKHGDSKAERCAAGVQHWKCIVLALILLPIAAAFWRHGAMHGTVHSSAVQEMAGQLLSARR